ncbi:MAG TPA: cupin-like domain-containing protein [Hyphomonadaceae bacterium]|nr:cupin-like domain-containing protein [Hyphomonadaceae bacterium]
MKPIPVWRNVTPAMFEGEIRPRAQPAVLKDIAGDWPIVRAARLGANACAEYLRGLSVGKPLHYVRAGPEVEGRLHYRDDVRAPNFERHESSLSDFLTALIAESEKERPDALAVQGLTAPDYAPNFAHDNSLDLLSPRITPRLWIGSAIKVATHSDPTENVACVAAGRRTFTLFPPEQVGNLYMGPFHITPAGTQVSMVHLTAPDHERYPRFAAALEFAEFAELEPGDGIYVPYQWYHHVESHDRFNILVNYWWDPSRGDVGSAWDVLMHGMMTLRNLPPDQRRAWRAMFDQYVFLSNGDPGAHLPPHVRGILAASTPQDIEQMRRSLIAKLQGR